MPAGCAACCLLAAILAASSPLRAEGMVHPVAGRAAADCARTGGDGRRLTYSDPRWGFTLTYPARFMLDPASMPESGASVRFATPDGRATAVVTGLRNGLRQSLAELREEVKQNITGNDHGNITYERATRDWFVLSGFVADRIYYQRVFLAHGGLVIATLRIEFPRDMRPCFEDDVTTMSLSFRPSGP